ncbi:MAG: tRNA (adenosine(37)-N6)-threonylcarbamoyltransferase complex transferase subunit TsaD, partial [Clostridiales bacterium]|nr:tRNA (adenosine(37)-N6)-threonylcarbamoyltransferase complex transferase subunit TsaD [Clostridiales bacterium]
MRYSEKVAKKVNGFNNIRILGIETSCDDTSASIVENGTKTLSLCTSSQILLHREFGGVVPEIASRNHTKNIGEVVKAAIEQANITNKKIDAIAVTASPGLLGALLAGISFAKGLAYALSVPIIATNHIAGHIAANYLSSEIKPPFVCLVASGGHSHIILVRDYLKYEVLGGTCDDAAGEALDKIARALGLPYPGGIYLEKLATEGNENAFGFKSQFNMSENRNFSFSGIKTAAANVLQSNNDVSKADVAASFQRAVVDTLVFKTILCAQSVSANT